jgi:hypothetical protein
VWHAVDYPATINKANLTGMEDNDNRQESQTNVCRFEEIHEEHGNKEFIQIKIR